MNDTEAMTAYLSSLQQAEFVDFYRKVKETHAALYIGGRQREVFTSEILEFKQMDPARWIKACRLAGIHSEVDMQGNQPRSVSESVPLLSEDAVAILILLRQKHREDPAAIPSIEQISTVLSLPVEEVDDSATELKVAGYANVHPVFGGIEQTGVQISDQGRVAAKHLMMRHDRGEVRDNRSEGTELHSIVTAGGKKTPGGTLLELGPGTKPRCVKAKVRLPGQSGWSIFDNLPVVNGIVKLPVKLVFLCHASEDKPTVEQVANRLTKEGFLAWVDKEILLPGDDWEQEIERAIESSDYVLVFLSRASCSKRGYVQREYDTPSNKEISAHRCNDTSFQY